MHNYFFKKASAAVMAAAMAVNGSVISAFTVNAADAQKYEFESATLQVPSKSIQNRVQAVAKLLT